MLNVLAVVKKHLPMLYEFAVVESTFQYWVRSSVLNALAVVESVLSGLITPAGAGTICRAWMRGHQSAGMVRVPVW